jgi:hypothetical protein
MVATPVARPILCRRWGIPTATDISLAWLVAVAVFGKGHPAVAFLLLLAVADDGVRAQSQLKTRCTCRAQLRKQPPSRRSDCSSSQCSTAIR